MVSATPKSKGSWIGIDLGTTNCTTAIWDLNQSSPKVLRLKHLAHVVENEKGGKIVPSIVTFYQSDGNQSGDDVVFEKSACEGLSTLVGRQALQSISNKNVPSDDIIQATITSFKRVLGITARQAIDLQKSEADYWNSLPFHPIILQDKLDHTSNRHDDHKHDVSSDETIDVLGKPNGETMKESKNLHDAVAIRIKPLTYNPLATKDDNKFRIGQVNESECLISPLQATTILLRSLLKAANTYLTKNKKISPPNSSTEDNTICNCIIGVPAHYSHSQRTIIKSAAKKAGFGGYVGVMTESTAAAMAYGLFVSPNKACEEKEKRILVFDMGGGTTDVTVAIMDADGTSTDNDEVKFRVVATAGDNCLGGDNVDELLARCLWKKMIKPTDTCHWQASKHQEFIGKCRVVKERLCGNDKENKAGLNEAHFTFNEMRIDVTKEEFETAIQPLVDRAERVVDDALKQIDSSMNTPIHEVVLIGGSSHISVIRDMLRRKFPPPIPSELCTSISAETAVAQGLAIQSALISGVVPLWELRNAMMLDTLPHSIGVWVDPRIAGDENGAPYQKGDILYGTKSKGHYVEILEKDLQLPARCSATFTLASKDQFGVTVVAVEHIADDTFQCMGVFTFLLHKLDHQQILAQITRQIEVGMVLETDGRFIVSVFDENDPEHRKKKRQFLHQKGIEDEDIDDEIGCSGTESRLLFLCAFVFAVYVATRIAFSDIDFQPNTDEM